MISVRDLKSRDEFESTERRLGARELERGDDEADEGVTDHGEDSVVFSDWESLICETCELYMSAVRISLWGKPVSEIRSWSG